MKGTQISHTKTEKKLLQSTQQHTTTIKRSLNLTWLICFFYQINNIHLPCEQPLNCSAISSSSLSHSIQLQIQTTKKYHNLIHSIYSAYVHTLQRQSKSRETLAAGVTPSSLYTPCCQDTRPRTSRPITKQTQTSASRCNALESI